LMAGLLPEMVNSGTTPQERIHGGQLPPTSRLTKLAGPKVIGGDCLNSEARRLQSLAASSTFLSERISHQQSAATSQQYSSLRTNQHQPSATSQPNSTSHQSLNHHGHINAPPHQKRPATSPTSSTMFGCAGRRGFFYQQPDFYRSGAVRVATAVTVVYH
jgi:hypothetical protein